MVGLRSSLGRDCQGEKVCPRQPTVLDWPRPRPRLQALLTVPGAPEEHTPGATPRAESTIHCSHRQDQPHARGAGPWQPLHWGARSSFGDWKLKSRLSSKSFHRDANNPLGCKQAEAASSLGKYRPFSPKGMSEQKRRPPTPEKGEYKPEGPPDGPRLGDRRVDRRAPRSAPGLPRSPRNTASLTAWDGGSGAPPPAPTGGGVQVHRGRKGGPAPRWM